MSKLSAEMMPPSIMAEIEGLCSTLDARIPAKSLDKNLLIATWNIRNFGAFNQSWNGLRGETPRRDRHSIHVIAEIIRRFDIIALQEIKSDTSALRAVYEILGENWSLILSDVTEGAAGNNERLAFLFDSRRVKLSGLACEIVIPPEHLGREEAGHLERQFARSPYAVGFRASSHTLTLVSLHVIWGRSTHDRIAELTSIAKWLARWSVDKHSWDQNLIALGDFNIERYHDGFHDALTSTGLTIPTDLIDAPRSIFKGKRNKLALYDQIAWFGGSNIGRRLTLEYSMGGSFDFRDCALLSQNLSLNELSWKLSDHLPLWIELFMPTIAIPD